jgi:hypothetical protein
MLKTEKTTLTSIGKDALFKATLEKLTLNKELSYEEESYLLACAILLLNHYEKDNRFTSYADLSYYIVLKYSLQTDDYKPLYDFSMSFGYYPIAKEIIKLGLLDVNSLEYCFDEIKLERFVNKKNYTETSEQRAETTRFLEDTSNEKSYLAPTSYGKSAIIVDYIEQLGAVDQKIAIIVPTKSLLAQTYQMIRQAGLGKKIIIHDEMYNSEKSFIAIFTQERALRLLRKQVSYDVLFIDEAHNIFKKDSRSILLSRLLAKNSNLNTNQRVIYLSPLVSDVANLKLSGDQKISDHRIKFNIKEPEIYEYELNGSISKFNRFVNQFYPVGSANSMFQYIIQNSGRKNFLYNYRPIKIEALAKELSNELSEIELTDSINDLIITLKREVHKDFFAVDYLRYGIIYIHGKIPDIIKEYLESKYKELDEVKYIIANSVILEGMNLPIDTLFVMNTRSLQGNELINLIGRVNRLNYVFNNDVNGLIKLLPNIHFINSEFYNRKSSNMRNKISLLRSRVFADKVENPILDSFDIDKLKGSKEQVARDKAKVLLIQKNEELLTQSPENTDGRLRQYLIESGINHFYTDLELVIPALLDRIAEITKGEAIEWDGFRMLDKIDYLFIGNNSDEYLSDFEIKRLGHNSTRNYYENHIRISQKKSLNENIVSQVKFFKEKGESIDPNLYFGSSYGEIPYDSSDYENRTQDVYIDLSIKNDRQLVNLAVVKLKMEDDFVSFKLNKLIVMLHDYGLISLDDYHLYVYGTTDTKKIALTKYGLNIGLVSRLQESEQLENLYFDEFNNLKSNSEFDKYLNALDDFYRFEIKRFIN